METGKRDNPCKVITYGLNYSDYDRQRELFALRNNGEIDIVAEIGYEPGDDEIFYKRMPSAQALSSDYDVIAVCSGTIQDALSDINSEGFEVDESGILDISSLTIGHREKIGSIQLQILSELVSASDDQISDRNWLGRRICDYGVFPFFKLAKNPKKGVTWSTLGILQVPDEFTEFCMFAAGLKCDSAIEVGVARGGSSYILAALLYRNNPDMKYHMVDINDCLVNFEQAKEIIPSLVKEIPSTSQGFARQRFDFCFIDADHSYDGMMADWKNVGQYAGKVTAFHDIYGHEYDHLAGGTVRAWREIRELQSAESIREFSIFPDKWMGIGVVIH